MLNFDYLDVSNTNSLVRRIQRIAQEKRMLHIVYKGEIVGYSWNETVRNCDPRSNDTEFHDGLYWVLLMSLTQQSSTFLSLGLALDVNLCY